MSGQDNVGVEKSASAVEVLDRLKRQEDKSMPGASVLTPKQSLLDASDCQKQNPDLRVRWVSVKNADKALARRMEGYEIIPEAKGGKRLGDDLVLMGISRSKYESRIKEQERLNKARLTQHKSEMTALAESLARQLRDRHGIDIDVDRLLVNEES